MYRNWMIFFWMKEFEQQCVLLNAFLKQGELSDHCSYIGLNDADFSSLCLSNAKHLFSEILSPKKHGQVRSGKTFSQDAVPVSSTATPPNITLYIYTGEQIYSPLSIKRKGFLTKLCSYFGVSYRKFVMLELNGRHWKLNIIVHFRHLLNVVKDFQKSMILSSLNFRSG